MSERNQVLVPLTLPEAPPRRRWGCGSPFLGGCGLLLLLLLVASVFVIGSGDRFFRWGLAQSRSTISAALPPEATAAERSQLEQAFRAVEEGVTSGRIDQQGLRRLREELGAARARIRSGTFGRAEVQALTGGLVQIAGGGEESTLPESGAEEGSQ